MRRPCIDCGRLTPQRTRCTTCESTRNIARHAARPQYQGDYKSRRAKLRRDARAVDAPCWICGGPIAWDVDPQHPQSLHADHVTPGDPQSALMPAHKACNERRRGHA